MAARPAFWAREYAVRACSSHASGCHSKFVVPDPRSSHPPTRVRLYVSFAACDARPICLSNADPRFVLANCEATEWLMEINVNSAKLPKYSYFEFFTANRVTTLK
jgi:hypothetical protein